MRAPSLGAHISFANLRTRCHGKAALSNTPLHRNYSEQSNRPRTFELESADGIITLHSRQKHKQYLGELLLSPPQKIGNYIRRCETIHAQIILSGFESNVFLNNILITVYAKGIGTFQTAAHLFDKMTERSLISWSSMILVYNQNGYNAEALKLFREFRRSSSDNPNEFVFATVVQSCTELRSTINGRYIHGCVIKAGYNQNPHVGTSLIDFYAKTSDLDAAKFVFDDLGKKTVVTWTAIIMGFSINGESNVSLNLFRKMVMTGIVPDKYALSCVLKACSMLHMLGLGKQVHAFVLRNVDNNDVSVGNALIGFYSKCGELLAGIRIFHQMMVKNVASWATMVSAYMQNGFHYESMALYKEMVRLRWSADGFACASLLISSGSVGALDLGKQVHAYTIKVDLDTDEFVTNSLIDMYCKCYVLTDARRVFLISGRCTAICYDAMIEGYSRQASLCEAIDCFNEMRHDLISPSRLTFVSLLGASASEFVSRQLHSLAIRSDAGLVFEEISKKDIVVWNSMLFGYALQSESEKAHKLYLEFLRLGENPNQHTFVAIVMASSNQANLFYGFQLYNQAVKTGLDSDPFVTNALVDMYAKCGNNAAAESIFNNAIHRDTACWNSIISMHANCGDAETALGTFKQMKADGVQPDYITFVAVLSACAHAGLVDEGLHHFSSMGQFKIEPGEEHYSSIVSLLGRAGKLDQARSFVENMPFQPTAHVWKSLLSGCIANGNLELGQYAAEMAISSDPRDSGSYVLLSNIFASKGMWTDVKEVRRKMESNAVVKETGCSWIELN
ncbi:pentatricopeptide repeat-containing protein At4g39530-like isoform X2 [Andrographis paniculata]|uniref:pentatricopeptide repeat-containing protein At4g39530-like isoform X2 n=1 Tax=Andrographis paniculata TaxID=175694 RepID=UPI0021E70FE6|nr:pentatricopeptide repeat-containing protein At4g39530-like isoform X2 [Andrographis paniculata]